jgi:hypothetical protein
MDDDVQLGESLLDELEGRTPRSIGNGMQRLPGAVDIAPHEMGLVDYIEEYAMFFVLAAVLVYFIYKSMINRYKSYQHTAAIRDAEESMRRARMLQQAKFELETAQRRDELARIEEERRKQKLEEMEAMAEGRSAKKPEKKKGPDTRQFWDRSDGFSMGGGSSSTRYTPTTRRRG